MRRPGPAAATRRQLAPAFVAAISAHDCPIVKLSIRANLGRQLSRLLHNPFPATPWTMERLELLADIVGYPREHILLVEEPQPQSPEDRIKAARPLVAQALHALVPKLPLVDCAAIANLALDKAAEGDKRPIAALLAGFTQLLERSDRTEAADSNTPATEPQP